MSDLRRELTRKERSAIKSLVVSSCANYCREYGCLLMGDACYMLGKCWTGSYCKYFRTAVLPLDHMLEIALIGGGGTQPCAMCGNQFRASGKRMYCSDACAIESQRKRNRAYMRKKRGW